jgi:hypothetical protein
MPRLLYALQVYEPELELARELALLHSDMQAGFVHNNVDVVLVYRRDCPADPVVEKLLGEAFHKVYTHRTERRETGFPAGPNGVWCDTINWVNDQHASGKMAYTCVLTTEADAIPLANNWPTQLLAAWQREDKKVIGCWCPSGDHKCGHINGNALFHPRIASMSRKLLGAPPHRAWDTWHAEEFRRLGWADIPEIRSWYHATQLEFEEIDALADDDCVWLHGIKDKSVLDWARTRLVPRQHLTDFPGFFESGLESFSCA